MFKDEKTDFKTPGADGDEYRSSDWWRLPGISEMRDGLQEIPSRIPSRAYFHPRHPALRLRLPCYI